MFKRSTRVKVKAFNAIVINAQEWDGEPGYRISIKDPYNGKHAFWTIVPESLVEEVTDEVTDD